MSKNRQYQMMTSFSLLVLIATPIAYSEDPSNVKDKERELQKLQNEVITKRKAINESILESYSDRIDLYDGRAYTKRRGGGQAKDKPKTQSEEGFPWELKCTSVDYRTIHGCLELRFFDPSARVYFDDGSDAPDEIDLFNDGNLNVSVDLVSIYWPWRLGRSEFYDSWSWGPAVGAGLSSSSDDSEDGTKTASNAPVVLFSAGGMLEYKLESGTAFAFEIGYSTGFSSDESFGDADDGAIYAGLRINLPLGKKDPPKAK